MFYGYLESLDNFGFHIEENYPDLGFFCSYPDPDPKWNRGPRHGGLVVFFSSSKDGIFCQG